MSQKIIKSTFKISTISLLTQIYIILCCFPQLIKFPITGYKFQPSELVFVPLCLLIITQKSFYSYLSNLFTSVNKSVKYHIYAICTYLLAVSISSLQNLSQSVFLEQMGVIYLISAFFILCYIFSNSEFGTADTWKKRFTYAIIIAALVGLAGWLLYLMGIENSTGFDRDYPYFGKVFRLKGFTPTPAFFLNIIGVAFLFIWTSSDKKIGYFSKNYLLFLVGLALILTLSKSLLVILICILSVEITKENLAKSWKVVGFITALGIFTFLQTATHFLFVSCEAAEMESTLQDDMYVSSLPIYQNGDFCILETNYLLYKRSATIAAYRNFPFGIGLGQHTHFLQNLSFEAAYKDKYKGHSGDTHCVYTGMFGELGILGLIAVIAIFYFLFLNANMIGLGFSSVVLFFVLEAINTDIFNFRHFWIFMALTVAIAAQKRLQ